MPKEGDIKKPVQLTFLILYCNIIIHHQSFDYMQRRQSVKLAIFTRTSMTLTLDRVMGHTVVYLSSTSTYTLNFIQMAKTFRGWMDVWKGERH